jgi:hypothetical protein
VVGTEQLLGGTPIQNNLQVRHKEAAGKGRGEFWHSIFHIAGVTQLQSQASKCSPVCCSQEVAHRLLLSGTHIQNLQVWCNGGLMGGGGGVKLSWHSTQGTAGASQSQW